jgi:hypothetical protein
MKRHWALIAATGLGSILLLGAASDAWAQRGGWDRPGGSGWERPGWCWNRGRGWRAGWPANPALGLGRAAAPPFRSGYGLPSPDPGVSSWNWPVSTCFNPMICNDRAPSYYFTYAPAPVVTARSVAAGGNGMHCSTPVETCLLRQASHIGSGCSCKVAGNPVRGSVTP